MRAHPGRRQSPANASRQAKYRGRVAYSLASVLLLSGLLWLAFEYFVRVEAEFGPVHHWLQFWWLKAHGTSAIAATWGFGVMWTVHIKRFWKQRKNRISGATMFALILTLIVSGAALYYATNEQLREWMSVLHWVLGLVAGIALIAHVICADRAADSDHQ